MAAARVELYTTPFCVLCERSRQLLEHAGVAFTEIDLSSDPDRCCELAALTGGSSAPRIMIDGRPIGGHDALTALQRDGRLADYASAEWTITSTADR